MCCCFNPQRTQLNLICFSSCCLRVIDTITFIRQITQTTSWCILFREHVRWHPGNALLHHGLPTMGFALTLHVLQRSNSGHAARIFIRMQIIFILWVDATTAPPAKRGNVLRELNATANLINLLIMVQI